MHRVFLFLLLFPSIQEDAPDATIRTRRGDILKVRDRAEAIRIRTALGMLSVPLADIDSLRSCRLREPELAKHLEKARDLVAQLPKKTGARQREDLLNAIVELGPIVLGEVRRAQDGLETKDALALNGAIDRLESGRPDLPCDEIVGADFRLRGWLEGPDPFEVETGYGTLKIKMTDLASYARRLRPKARSTGTFLVECRDGSALRADLKGALTLVSGEKRSTFEAADITSVSIGRSDAIGTKKGRGVGTLEEKEIPLATIFGEAKLIKGELRGMATAGWEPQSKKALTQLGYVTEWLVIGNFNEPDDSALVRNFLGVREPEAAPAEGEKVGGKKWLASKTAEGDIDFLAVTGATEPAEGNDLFYACAYVWSATDWTGRMGANSDDGIRVWLGGALIHDNHEHRGRGSPGSDQDVVPATIKAGWSALLVKVDNGAGPTGFSIRFMTDGGQPAPGVMTTIERPPSLRRLP